MAVETKGGASAREASIAIFSAADCDIFLTPVLSRLGGMSWGQEQGTAAAKTGGAAIGKVREKESPAGRFGDFGESGEVTATVEASRVL